MKRESYFAFSALFGAVCALVYWPWLLIVFPLTMIFGPLEKIGYSLGYSSEIVMVLLGIAEFIVSYLICVAVVCIALYIIIKIYIRRNEYWLKQREKDEVLKD